MPKSFYWAVASVVVMVVGAFGPWASVLNLTINGTTDAEDGWIVVGAAAVAALLLAIYAMSRRRWLFWLVLLAAAAGAATTGYDIGDIERTFGDSAGVDTEWGIYVALIGSISLALAAVVSFFTAKRPVEPAVPAAPPPPAA